MDQRLFIHYQRLVVAYKPAQIVLLCGANDLYNGVSIERVFEDIKCFCRLLDIHLPGVPVILLSFHPSPSMPDWIPKEREVNKLILTTSKTATKLPTLI